jgi:hypothetical protein
MYIQYLGITGSSLNQTLAAPTAGGEGFFFQAHIHTAHNPPTHSPLPAAGSCMYLGYPSITSQIPQRQEAPSGSVTEKEGSQEFVHRLGICAPVDFSRVIRCEQHRSLLVDPFRQEVACQSFTVSQSSDILRHTHLHLLFDNPS